MLYLQKPVWLPVSCPAHFNPSWVLAFLSSFLCLQFSFQPACPHFHILCISLCLSSVRSFTFIHAGFLPHLLDFWCFGMNHSHALRRLPWTLASFPQPLCCFPSCPLGAYSHQNLPSSDAKVHEEAKMIFPWSPQFYCHCLSSSFFLESWTPHSLTVTV